MPTNTADGGSGTINERTINERRRVVRNATARSGPNITSSVVSTIQAGTILNFDRRSGNFIRVQGQNSWINQSMTQLYGNNSTPSMQTINERRIIIREGAVKSGPANSFSTIRREFPGKSFTFDRRSGSYIRIQGTNHWVLQSITQLQRDESPPPRTDTTNNNSGSSSRSRTQDVVNNDSRRLEEQARASADNDPERLLLDSNDVFGDVAGALQSIMGANTGNPADPVRGIFGMPYQFLEYADFRYPGYPYGRIYNERIVSRMPILALSPGKPQFLDGLDEGSLSNFVTNIGNIVTNATTVLHGVNTENNRAYLFKFAYADYYEYVNALCQTTSVLLGIGDLRVNGNTGPRYKNYDWSNYQNQNEVEHFITGREHVCFYIDGESQISQSFSNATRDSMLKGLVDQGSELAREVEFLTGMASGSANMSETIADIGNTIEQMLQGLGSGTAGSIMETMGQQISTIMQGGQMLFPEIWSNSDYSTSYDVTIKLQAYDADPETIMREIYAPMFHLIAMVAPLQLNANGYKSPFVVRGFHQGLIDVQMGIITNMTIKRGGEGAWTLDNLPTEVEINFTIKDLYEMITLTKISNPINLVNNSPLMDYMATLAGVNMAGPELALRVSLYHSAVQDKAFNLPNRVGRRITEKFSNIANRFLSGTR